MTPPTTRTLPASPAAMLHASNLLTYAALGAGLAAIVCAVWLQNASLAGACIAFSVVLDTFDGRFARRFPRTPAERAFGMQLDSLADAINSGVVPVVVTMSLGRPSTVAAAFLWFGAALAYIVGVVTRLGYYNLADEDGAVFIGLPAPVAALIVATMLLWPLPIASAALVLSACALAMISPMRIPRPKGIGLLIFALWPLTIIALHLFAGASEL